MVIWRRPPREQSPRYRQMRPSPSETAGYQVVITRSLASDVTFSRQAGLAAHVELGSVVQHYSITSRRIGDRGHMPNSGSSRKQQRLKIEEIGRTLAECGFVTLDEQAYVLGLSRSTAWTVIRGTHKTSGLSAMTINRMLATDHLPLRVRLKLLEYVAEKMSGAYGDQEHRLKAFASKISPVHMFLVEPNQAGRLSCVRSAVDAAPAL